MDFGAFVNFFGAKDGLVHISQLAPRRVNKVTDVVKEGDKVKVKLLGLDERGKVRLSMKAVDQATGEDLEGKQRAEGRAAAGRARRRRGVTARTSSIKGGPGRPFILPAQACATPLAVPSAFVDDVAERREVLASRRGAPPNARPMMRAG